MPTKLSLENLFQHPNMADKTSSKSINYFISVDMSSLRSEK